MEEIAASGRPAFYEPDAAHIVDRLVPLLQPDDVVAVFSNGGFDGIHEKILERLSSAPPDEDADAAKVSRSTCGRAQSASLPAASRKSSVNRPCGWSAFPFQTPASRPPSPSQPLSSVTFTSAKASVPIFARLSYFAL